MPVRATNKKVVALDSEKSAELRAQAHFLATGWAAWLPQRPILQLQDTLPLAQPVRASGSDICLVTKEKLGQKRMPTDGHGGIPA